MHLMMTNETRYHFDNMASNASYPDKNNYYNFDHNNFTDFRNNGTYGKDWLVTTTLIERQNK